jgi:hypothetical protein
MAKEQRSNPACRSRHSGACPGGLGAGLHAIGVTAPHLDVEDLRKAVEAV